MVTSPLKHYCPIIKVCIANSTFSTSETDGDCLLSGLSHTPRSDKSEIAFNLNDVETYLAYTKAMREFLVMYDDDKQRDQMKYEDCGGTGSVPFRSTPSP